MHMGGPIGMTETLVGTGTTNYHPGFINGLRECYS